MTTITNNPYNLQDGTRLHHKKGGIYTYHFDLCYQEFLLWNPFAGSYYEPDNFNRDDFEIITEGEYKYRERNWIG